VVRSGEFCLSDTDRRSLLVDIQLLHDFAAAQQAVIIEYNKTIMGAGH